MKKILIFLPLLFINSGCQAVLQSATQTSTGCPQEPNVRLREENITKVSLSDKTLKTSGETSADKPVGFIFEAKSGQKLSYHTSDDICIQLYTQDNKLLNSGDLPEDGKYILEVSKPKGSTTFNLEMSFATLEASTPSVPQPPVKRLGVNFYNASESRSSRNTATSSSNASELEQLSNSSSVTTETSDLTQEQALTILQKWYDAKPRIFAPPFDTSSLDELTTGKFYDDKTKPGGVIDWLRTHGSYYTYNYSRINHVIYYSSTGEEPVISVNVEEELYLHEPDGINNRHSGAYEGNFIYCFRKENGVWKISDSKKANSDGGD